MVPLFVLFGHCLIVGHGQPAVLCCEGSGELTRQAWPNVLGTWNGTQCLRPVDHRESHRLAQLITKSTAFGVVHAREVARPAMR
jgi:hypothetical protein